MAKIYACTVWIPLCNSSNKVLWDKNKNPVTTKSPPSILLETMYQKDNFLLQNLKIGNIKTAIAMTARPLITSRTIPKVFASGLPLPITLYATRISTPTIIEVFLCVFISCSLLVFPIYENIITYSFENIYVKVKPNRIIWMNN